MAYLKQAKTEEQIKSLTIANVKKAYNELSSDYNKLINLDYIYCPCCGEFKSASAFYTSKKTKSGLEHLGCKSCILDMATDYDKKTGVRTDNKEKTIEVFRKLDLPFVESAYNSALDSVNESVNEKNRSTAFQQLLVMVKSLPQWSSSTFKDSEYLLEENNPEYEQKEIKKVISAGRKRFGADYNNQELMFLETEFQDWITKYECNTKAQEEIFKNLSANRLERKQAVKQNKPTKEIDKTFQELLATQNIQPRQSGMDTFADAQTFGTLIQKYEETRPLPEIDESLKDVDNIGLYLDTFYKGNILKCLGLKNPLHHLYEKIMKLFTVEKPEAQEDEDTSTLFEFIFGKDEEE